jgi:hypothetical protein
MEMIFYLTHQRAHFSNNYTTKNKPLSFIRLVFLIKEIYYQINLQNIIATISSNCLSYSLLCSFLLAYTLIPVQLFNNLINFPSQKRKV